MTLYARWMKFCRGKDIGVKQILSSQRLGPTTRSELVEAWPGDRGHDRERWAAGGTVGGDTSDTEVHQILGRKWELWLESRIDAHGPNACGPVYQLRCKWTIRHNFDGFPGAREGGVVFGGALRA
jgi:hypothetical protein